MLDSLIQQFAGGEPQNLEGQQLHGGVAQMMEKAPNHHNVSAVSDALGALGGGGLADSVLQGASHASPQQRNGLADVLLNAVSQGGGSPNNVLSQLGIGGGGTMNPQELATLAGYVGNNHGGALSQILGNQIGNGSGGSSLLSLLGNPMVRQVGMSLAQKLLK